MEPPLLNFFLCLCRSTSWMTLLTTGHPSMQLPWLNSNCCHADVCKLKLVYCLSLGIHWEPKDLICFFSHHSFQHSSHINNDFRLDFVKKVNASWVIARLAGKLGCRKEWDSFLRPDTNQHFYELLYFY